MSDLVLAAKQLDEIQARTAETEHPEITASELIVLIDEVRRLRLEDANLAHNINVIHIDLKTLTAKITKNVEALAAERDRLAAALAELLAASDTSAREGFNAERMALAMDAARAALEGRAA